MLVTLILMFSCIASVYPMESIMKDVTMGFGEALKHCREESQLTEEKMEEFFHVWRDDFVFKDRELGCAILCMGKHFNLATDSDRMHHENMDLFIKSFPGGEKLARIMIEMIHTCEKKFNHEEDVCWRILHTAECFTNQAKKDNIAPNIEMIIAEFMMDAEG